MAIFVPPADVVAFLGPRWRLKFNRPGTLEVVDTFADLPMSLPHAQPVRLDRFGNIPSIYFEQDQDTLVTIENEFGVFRYKFTSQAILGRITEDGNTRITESGDRRIID